MAENIMGIFESHAHYDDEAFNEDRRELLKELPEKGIEYVVNVGASMESTKSSIALAGEYDYIYAAVGVHPNETAPLTEEFIQYMKYAALHNKKVVAVGEIGLDYYWDDRFKAEQLEAFTKQCRLAATYDLPVAIHTRAAWKDMCRTVETETKAAREKGLRLRGVFHAFAEDADTYRQLKECGDFLFGIGGVVTFKKSRLADTVREMELDDLVLETDCPYLTPVPYRGQRNESGYIPYICNKIAALKGTGTTFGIGQLAEQVQLPLGGSSKGVGLGRLATIEATQRTLRGKRH